MLEQTLGNFVAPALLSEAATWTPFVDIEEQNDACVIEAELPAVKREDVHVELLGNELATGEIKERERTGVVRPGSSSPRATRSMRPAMRGSSRARGTP
jgi:HSP20 family protein